jgi:hypothetical protein
LLQKPDILTCYRQLSLESCGKQMKCPVIVANEMSGLGSSVNKATDNIPGHAGGVIPVATFRGFVPFSSFDEASGSRHNQQSDRGLLWIDKFILQFSQLAGRGRTNV